MIKMKKAQLWCHKCNGIVRHTFYLDGAILYMRVCRGCGETTFKAVVKTWTS